MNNPAQERNDVVDRLAQAVALIEWSLDRRLVPEHGVSIGYAIRGARDSNGVAAVQGGIMAGGTKPRAAGPCGFGMDDGIARIILTAMKFDPLMRSAASIQFTGRARAVLEDDLFLECITCDPRQSPAGISTMDWGIASCCGEGVPDAIFRPGAGGDLALISLFGEDPVGIANNIIICSNRI
jgi:hydroxymethylpyrimidine/phosphomethylpyrimidine kinase